MTLGFTVIADDICQLHGGHNYAYQYDDENFVRIGSICEGCAKGWPPIKVKEDQVDNESKDQGAANH